MYIHWVHVMSAVAACCQSGFLNLQHTETLKLSLERKPKEAGREVGGGLFLLQRYSTEGGMKWLLLNSIHLQIKEAKASTLQLLVYMTKHPSSDCCSNPLTLNVHLPLFIINFKNQLLIVFLFYNIIHAHGKALTIQRGKIPFLCVNWCHLRGNVSSKFLGYPQECSLWDWGQSTCSSPGTPPSETKQKQQLL